METGNRGKEAGAVEGTMPAAVMRQTNRRQVYQYMYENAGNHTVAEISEALFMDPATVLESLDELVKVNLVISGLGGGAYALDAQALYAVGISIECGGAYIAVLDMRLRELAGLELELPFHHADAYYRRLVQEMESLLDASGMDRDRMLGVGITVPGMIDQGVGKLVMAPALNLWDVPLEEIYREFSRYPVYVENDANASGYLERWLDGGQRDMLYLSLKRGIGGTLLLRERQYAGDNGRSGEFGHLRIVPNGRLCHCGRRGCLDAYCSVDRLSADLGVTLEEFFARLEAGDEAFTNLWEEYRGRLTDALAMLRMSFDCDIMLGGTLAAYLEPHFPELYRELGEKTLFETDRTFLRLERYGPHSECAGTALRFIDDFLLTF